MFPRWHPTLVPFKLVVVFAKYNVETSVWFPLVESPETLNEMFACGSNDIGNIVPVEVTRLD